jgi:hypothetical protein
MASILGPWAFHPIRTPDLAWWHAVAWPQVAYTTRAYNVAHVAVAHCRAGPPVPPALSEGIKEADIKDLAVRLLAPINRILGAQQGSMAALCWCSHGSVRSACVVPASLSFS